MFVTSTSFSGGMGGIAGADAICAGAAANLTGTYVAWLSVVGNEAKVDLPIGKTLIRRDGATIVTNAEDLILGPDTMLLNPINVAEDGTNVVGFAWTSTNSLGSASTINCKLWSSNSMGDFATVGRIESKNFEWTEANPDVPNNNLRCIAMNHIYCLRTVP